MTLILERTTIDRLTETYPQVLKRIVSEHFNLSDSEYNEHGGYLILKQEDTYFALFANTAKTDTFEEALELCACQLGWISQGSADDRALAKRFWEEGRAIEAKQVNWGS
jgi:hypothetical protein